MDGYFAPEVDMKPFMEMNDKELHGLIRELKRDTHNFSVRAAHVAAALRIEGREVHGDALHRRYASIRDFLLSRLIDAEREARRRAESAARPRLSVGSAILDLCLPWRRARATR
jgi:hypothetical protein